MIDWFEIAKLAPGIVGTLTGGLALYLNRRDARAASARSLPIATLTFNPHKDDSGWYLVKIFFDNVRQPIIISKISIASPKRMLIASRLKSNSDVAVVRDESNLSRSIKADWKAGVGFPHTQGFIFIKPKATMLGERLVVNIKGNSVTGM